MLLILAAVSLGHTNRGSQEGCRVRDNRVALGYLIVLHSCSAHMLSVP